MFVPQLGTSRHVRLNRVVNSSYAWAQLNVQLFRYRATIESMEASELRTNVESFS